GGLRVDLVDKGVGPDVKVGFASTDANGAYRITIPAAVIKRRGKTAPDLQARVYTGETFLGASSVHYNAAPLESIDVVLPDSAAPQLPSEHEALTQAVSALYDGSLRDLQETDERQDISYLANKSGWDARAVALASLADRFAQDRAPAPTGALNVSTTRVARASKSKKADASIDPAFYYALLRAGVPSTPDALYAVGAKAANDVWTQAIAQGVIPKALESQIPQALQAFQSMAASQMLSARAVAGTSSLKEMLQLTLGDDAPKLQRFAELSVAHADDPEEFWTEVERAFGSSTTQRLQLDGELGALTLNNAALMERLHLNEREKPVNSTLDLVQRGYYKSSAWSNLLDDTVPDAIPGSTLEARKTNYAQLLASQVQLNHPTAVVAEQVKSGQVALTADPALRAGVHEFLTAHQDNFELGLHPVEQFVIDNGLAKAVEPEVVDQLKRLHRVYQITPSDQAMNALLKKDVTSAYQVVHYGQDAFVRDFGAAIDLEMRNDEFTGDLSGAALAQMTFTKAQSVYNSVVQVSVDYALRRVTPSFGSDRGQKLSPFPHNSGNSNGGSTTPAPDTPPQSAASATLEKIFGSMDSCECEECRSIIGPAAYLVDLLNFANPQTLPAGSANPQDVLFERRPDIRHVMLTCPNTSKAMPYIDLGLEALEHFVVNGSMDGFRGFNTDEDISSEDLIATPQNIDDNAYVILGGDQALFPPPLPYHRSLELLRKLFRKFDIGLADAMTSLRTTDDLDYSGSALYGWRDILMEELGLSRPEYKLLTDSTLTLQQLYGYPAATSDAAVIDALSNAEVFVRRLSLEANDLVKILGTRFINAGAGLIPALTKLSVTFEALLEVSNGTMDAPTFLALLPTGTAAPDPASFGGDIVAWIVANQADIMRLIVMSNPTNPSDLCNLSELRLRYANPDATANTLVVADFVRLLRFIRLWRKLGLSIQQTDDLLSALLPLNAKIAVGGTFAPGVALAGTVDGIAWSFTTPAAGTLADVATGLAASIRTAAPAYAVSVNGTGVFVARSDASTTAAVKLNVTGAGTVTLTVTSDAAHDVQDLDAAFLTLLPRIGFAFRSMKALELTPADDLRNALALWAPIGANGKHSLYASMFLNPVSPLRDDAFSPSSTGQLFWATPSALLFAHEMAMRGAFNLTGSEFALITQGQTLTPPITSALNFDKATTPLTLENVSAVYRRGMLARTLGISVLELLLLA
ncbi:MAG TPA: hypothetical protein VII30_07830, partial [Gemmatimonadaceae bacterium]